MLTWSSTFMRISIVSLAVFCASLVSHGLRGWRCFLDFHAGFKLYTHISTHINIYAHSTYEDFSWLQMSLCRVTVQLSTTDLGTVCVTLLNMHFPFLRSPFIVIFWHLIDKKCEKYFVCSHKWKSTLKKWLYYFYCALFFGRLKPLGRFCLCAPYVIVKQNAFKSRSFSNSVICFM